MSFVSGFLTRDRLLRSVFISNVPQEINEELLKDLFSEIGPVINLRLFYDNDIGKSKGCAFCEYKDQEMALSAIRNLNGYEIKGRILHVDIAASEKSKMELESLQGSSNEPLPELSAGSESTPEKAPEEISKAVASLPAEQMFELMKQMKMCIENNPQEARNLLLQNPQLAYALLQAQVIMRIVDPDVAMKILSRPSGVPVGSGLLSNPDMKPNLESTASIPSSVSDVPTTFPVGLSGQPASVHSAIPSAPRMLHNLQSRPSLLGDGPPAMNMPPISVMTAQFSDRGDRDLRQLPLMERDVRSAAAQMGDKDMRQALVDQDFRTQNISGGMPDNRPFDPRFRAMQNPDLNRPSASVYERSRGSTNIDPRTAYEGRGISAQSRIEDPRKASNAAAVGASVPPVILPNVRLSSVSAPPTVTAPSNVVPSLRQPPSLPTGGLMGVPPDQEKAALIMQVLQLSDQQIAMLPPEQRQSIMVLKEQIARSQLT